MIRTASALFCILLAFLVIGGCSGPASSREGGYSVDESGRLSLRCPPCTVTETVLERGGNVTLSRLVFQGSGGAVYAILAAPPEPAAGFVLAPGAGVKKEGYAPVARMYAERGYAFLVLDVRGNGGETPGYPLDLPRDFEAFRAGEWPEYYLSICDISSARRYLGERYSVPVYAMGESNGGRVCRNRGRDGSCVCRVYRYLDERVLACRRIVFRRCTPFPPIGRPPNPGRDALPAPVMDLPCAR